MVNFLDFSTTDTTGRSTVRLLHTVTTTKNGKTPASGLPKFNCKNYGVRVSKPKQLFTTRQQDFTV